MSRQKLIALLISILPIAYIYSFPFLINNLGHAILLFLVFPLLISDYISKTDRRNGKMLQYYSLFSLWLVLISFITPLILGFEGDLRELFSAAEFSVIVFFLLSDNRISSTFIEIYTRVAVFFAVFLIIQYFAFFVGINISGRISFLTEYNREVESITEGRLLRISSMFAEPSHFAVYEIPALIMYLWKNTNQKGVIAKIAIISLSILLSTSANGIIVMGVVYLAYVIYRFFIRVRPVYFIIGGCILFGAYHFVKSSTYMGDVTYGLLIEEADMSTSKAELRIYRGFKMYADMPYERQVLGVGWRNAQRYCRACNNNLFSKYYAEVFDYFNSIAGTLIYSGIIGLLLLLLFFYSLYKTTTDFGTQTLIVCVLILMGTSSVLMSDQWVLYLATIISMTNKHYKNENEKNYSYNLS